MNKVRTPRQEMAYYMKKAEAAKAKGNMMRYNHNMQEYKKWEAEYNRAKNA